MNSTPTLILLPGMHGTNDLWEPFLNVLPAEQSRRTISYPTDQLLDYDALLQLIERELRDEKDMVVIGESFSGPLALRLAATHPDRVRAAILTGSFIRPPLRSWIRWLFLPIFFKAPLPAFAIRYAVAGANASDALVERIRSAIHKPTAEVLAHRATCVLTVDCVDALRGAKKVVCLVPDEDHMVWRYNLTPIVRARPDVVVIRMRGPHLILQAEPQAAWELIRQFLT